MVDIKIDTAVVRGDKGVMVGAQYQHPGRQSPFLGRWVVSSQLASSDSPHRPLDASRPVRLLFTLAQQSKHALVSVQLSCSLQSLT
jgi:hypothetical protein